MDMVSESQCKVSTKRIYGARKVDILALFVFFTVVLQLSMLLNVLVTLSCRQSFLKALPPIALLSMANTHEFMCSIVHTCPAHMHASLAVLRPL